jgi:hypothetical protein
LISIHRDLLDSVMAAAAQAGTGAGWAEDPFLRWPEGQQEEEGGKTYRRRSPVFIPLAW